MEEMDIYVIAGAVEHGLGYKVVTNLRQEIYGKWHKVIFDNFFTSMESFFLLKSFFATKHSLLGLWELVGEVSQRNYLIRRSWNNLQKETCYLDWQQTSAHGLNHSTTSRWKHWSEATNEKGVRMQRRCNICLKKPTYWCEDCDVGLCPAPCFRIYYTWLRIFVIKLFFCFSVVQTLLKVVFYYYEKNFNVLPRGKFINISMLDKKWNIYILQIHVWK